jgi:hypothetical protein
MTQVVQHLPRKNKVLSSKPSTAKNKQYIYCSIGEIWITWTWVKKLNLVVEHLPSVRKAPSLIPSTTKNTCMHAYIIHTALHERKALGLVPSTTKYIHACIHIYRLGWVKPLVWSPAPQKINCQTIMSTHGFVCSEWVVFIFVNTWYYHFINSSGSMCVVLSV